MKIRQIEFKEENVIYDFIKKAFETAEVSDGTEQNFVLQLRSGKNYIPELELIAEENGELIGHILFTKQKVIIKEKEKQALLLAPLSVKLEWRSQGVGGKLIQEGFQRAKKLGYEVVFLIGNPKYYQRFGFCQTTKFGIKNDSDIPDLYVLGCALVPHVLDNVTGSIHIEG